MGQWTHLYKTRTWKQLRQAQLQREPLCRMHMETGQVVPGDTVDHVKPHRGDMALFSNPRNLQTLCRQCHSSHKQRQEKRGVLAGADESGMPLDPSHHWNRGVVEK